MTDDHNVDLLSLTTDIVTSHVANNTVSATELPALIKATYDALAGLGSPDEAPAEALTPAVSIRASIKPDYLICLEDGKKLTMLKRYLGRKYGMTPDEYRAKWGLPYDYPMIAPSYAAKRKEVAKSIGLGRRGATPSK